jgi:hypothetical protein
MGAGEVPDAHEKLAHNLAAGEAKRLLGRRDVAVGGHGYWLLAIGYWLFHLLAMLILAP